MQRLIYNQRRIPQEQWRYGLRSSAKIGCGWIAVYNALCLLDIPVQIPELIRRMERQLPGINGMLGSFLGSPALTLRQYGVPVRICNDRSKYDALAKEAPVVLLSYYWLRKPRAGAHVIAVRYENGGFIGYNTFSNSSGPDHLGKSLEGFLKRHRYFGSVLTIVNVKEQ